MASEDRPPTASDAAPESDGAADRTARDATACPPQASCQVAADPAGGSASRPCGSGRRAVPSAERIGGDRPHGFDGRAAARMSDGRMSTLEPVSAVRHDAAQDLARALDPRSARLPPGVVPMVTDDPGSRALGRPHQDPCRAPHRWTRATGDHARRLRAAWRQARPAPDDPSCDGPRSSMRWTTARPGSNVAKGDGRRCGPPTSKTEPERPGPDRSGDDALARQARLAAEQRRL